MMKKRRRDNIIAILLLIVVFIGIRVFQNSVDRKNTQLTQLGKTTVGQIIKRDLPGARTISSIRYKFVYYVNGIRTENWSSTDNRYPVGSFFEVTYLPNAPHKSRLEFEVSVSPDSVCIYFDEDCPFVSE